jgi:hypothetical protein
MRQALRQEIVDEDVKCGEKVVEVGEHRDPPPVVDVVGDTPTFDAFLACPTQPIAAPAD